MIKNQRILLIDDDESLAEAVKLILEEEGHEVIVTHSSKNVDSLIQTHQPDVILLDYRLPGENGVSVAERLKKRDSTQDIPIVMISSSYSIQKPAMTAGADAFLPKPFSFSTLLNTISTVVEYRR